MSVNHKENSSHVVESENQASTGSQYELVNKHKPPDQGENLSNFLYPSVSPFPSFLLPPERPINEKNDTSHIPIVQLASLEEEVERNLSKVSRKGKLPMPRGEGSSKQVDHFDTISPLENDIGKVFRDFWNVG